MLNKAVRILDFDRSIVKQRNLIERYRPQVIDLTDIGPRARFWLDRRTREAIRERLGDSAKHAVTFLGSGDFHQVSNILIGQFERPLSVITFDFHPDWDMLPPRLHCGAWVTETLKNSTIQKFVLMGVSSKDISTFRIQTGNLGSLRDNRLEIYSYAHEPSRVFFKNVPRNTSVHVDRGVFTSTLRWQELKGQDLGAFMRQITRRLPTRSVYVSIDKDCLTNLHALTNWEEGMFSLDELIVMLRVIQEDCDVQGVDVVGDWSPIDLEGGLKKILSRMDHPKRVKAQETGEAEATARNEATNLKLLEVLLPSAL